MLQSVSLLLLGVSLGLASPPGLTGLTLVRGGCPMFWFGFEGSCYKYGSSRQTWAEAEIHCLSEDANLVSIQSPEENDFVQTLIQNFDHTEGHTWIGFSDIHKEGTWMRADGCPMKFDMWDVAQPDNNDGNERCAEIKSGAVWNDHPCSNTYPFVCKTRRATC